MEKGEIVEALRKLAGDLEAHTGDSSLQNLRGVLTYGSSDLRRLANQIEQSGQAEEA